MDTSESSPADLPVGTPWFHVETIDASVTLITEPHVHPLLSANIWHVHGRDRDLLVDTGLGVARLRPALADLLEREPVVILTHGHLDHQGAAHEFAEVWAHRLEDISGQPGTLYAAPLVSALLADDPGVEGWDLPEVLVTARPYAAYRPDDYRLRPAGTTRLLDDGDVVDLGDRSFTVLHLPGHTPGSIGLHDRDNGVLFTGDVIYDDELIDNCVGADMSDYLTTMRRLLTLDVATVHAGHATSFDGTRLHELATQYIDSRSRA